MNKAAAASLVVAGAWVAGLSAAGVAAATPAEGDTASASVADHDPSAHSKRSATRPSASRNPAHRRSARRAAKPAARQVAATVHSTSASAKAASTHPIVALFFNHTPTLLPTQEAPRLDGVVHGALNAADSDGNTLTYTVAAEPVHGKVLLDGSGLHLHPDRRRTTSPPQTLSPSASAMPEAVSTCTACWVWSTC